MNRKFLLLAIFACLFSTTLLAQNIGIVPQNNTITAPSDVIQTVTDFSFQWMKSCETYAYDIFWSLAALEFIFIGIDVIYKFRSNWQVGAMMASYEIIVVSVALTLLMNGDQWIPMIVNSFSIIGADASGYGKIAPSDIMMAGSTLSAKLLLGAGKGALLIDPGSVLAFILAAFVIDLCFIFLTVTFVMAKVHMAVAIGLGYIFLGFGSSRWTRNLMENFFRYGISAGIRMMTIYMLLGFGSTLTDTWVDQVKNISFWSLNADIAFGIMGGALLYAVVVWGISDLAATVLGGSPNFSAGQMFALVTGAMSLTHPAGVAGAASSVSKAAMNTANYMVKGTSGGNANPPPSPGAPTSYPGGGGGGGGSPRPHAPHAPRGRPPRYGFAGYR